MISINPKFIFIHVPKAAGSSIEMALKSYSITPITFEDNGNALLKNKHMPSKRIISALGWEQWSQFYSFAVIRNPWDRVVSNFFHLKEIGHKRVEGCESVHEWVMQDRVWCLPICHYLVHEGKVTVSKAIRYDQLADSFADVCRTIGIKGPPLPHINRSKHEPFQSYYDPDSRKRVGVLFAEDIERFNFDFSQE